MQTHDTVHRPHSDPRWRHSMQMHVFASVEEEFLHVVGRQHALMRQNDMQ
jgi:hypothetical protein